MRLVSFRIRGALLYAALFFLIGIYLPFFPVWLKSRGLSESEIAAVLALQIAVRIFSGPLFAFLADWTGERRKLIVFLALVPFLGVVLLTGLDSKPLIAIVSITAAFFWGPILPMTEAIAVRGAEKEGLDYGRMRLWGSLAFILANICGGLSLDAANPQFIIVILAISHGFVFLAVLGLPREIVRADGNLGQRKVQFSDALRLLGQPVFLAFMIAASLVQASHAVYYGFGTLHWQATGIPGGLIGMLWGLGVLAEVVLFYVSGRALSLLGPSGLLFVGAFAAILRWVGTSLEPGLYGLVFLQMLHGLTFGATHLAIIHFISRSVPAALHSTAQGLYSSIASGIAISVATASAGPLYRTFGSDAFLAMSMLGVVSAALALGLMAKGVGLPQRQES